MKPIDPRLLRHARATRFFLAGTVALGGVGAGLVIAQAMLIAEIVVGAFHHGGGLASLRTALLLLVAVALGRALVAWLTELAAHRTSAAVKSELRGRLLACAADLGPGRLSGQRTGSLITLATRGVDALDDYFARYLPQLGLAVVVPVAVLARIVTADWISAAIIVVTLPLIPLFMALIGWVTQSRTDHQWRLLSRLSGHFLDVVEGLPTLKVFGRAKAQAYSIRAITAEYRQATLRTLRIAFLSSFALELLSTLSVALVAVGIGLRLVHGGLDLYTGLVVLVLAPEAYLPIRQVGTQYHAAAEGLAAAGEIFAVLESADSRHSERSERSERSRHGEGGRHGEHSQHSQHSQHGEKTAENTEGDKGVPRGAGGQAPASVRLELRDVTVRHEGRALASLAAATLTVEPGETVALAGPSGVGKSTLLDVVLGFVRPAAGEVRLGGVDLEDVDLAGWREQIAWVPQRPYLFAGSVADNVRLARPDADDAAVGTALRQAGAYDFVAALPQGAETVLREDGAGLSAGQRQRLALARAFLADRPLLLLDEPTAALDGATEAAVVDAIRRLAAGRTVLLVAHRPALLAAADRVVTLTDAGATSVVAAARTGAGRPGLPVRSPQRDRSPIAAAGGTLRGSAASAQAQDQAQARDQAQAQAQAQDQDQDQDQARDQDQAQDQAQSQAQDQAQAQAQDQAQSQAQDQAQAQAQAQAQDQAQAQAQAQDQAQARDQAQVWDQAQARDQAQVWDQAQARDQAQAQDQAQVRAEAEVQGQARTTNETTRVLAGLRVMRHAGEAAEDREASENSNATRSGAGAATGTGTKLGVKPGTGTKPGRGIRIHSVPAPEASSARKDSAPVPSPRAAASVTSVASGPLARVRATAGPLRGRFLLALLLGGLATASAIGLLAVSGWLISRASQHPPVLFLMVAVTATRTFGIGRAVFRYAERLVSHDAVLRLLAGVRVGVYRRLERIAPAGLRTTGRGDLLTRLVSDVDQLQDYWLRWLLPAGASLLVCAATVAFTAWLLPAAGAVLAAGLLVAGVAVPALSGGVARRAEQRLAPARGVLAVRVAELLGGLGEITVAGALPGRLRRTRSADADLTEIASRGAAATALGAGLSALACCLTVTAAAVVGIQAVRDGRLPGVDLAVVVLTPLAAFEAVTGLPLAVQSRQRARRSAERVYGVLDAPVPVTEPERPATPPAAPFPLRLDGVGARYPDGERDALTGFDLTLTAGRRVAVVGPSGSGKSTLAQVMLRFLDVREGSWRLAGVDAGTLAGEDVRRFVGLCAQDAHLFDSSVRENLRLARTDATEAELRTALGAARLLDWVDGLPHGLDTLVGEHGAQLSGGQRQRLALARALLADFPVLVLDEPAEHLDLATGDALTADLLAATEGRTTLLITHRLHGLDAVDEVIVLEEGRTVQRGPYAKLAAVEGPLRRMIARERAGDRAGELLAAG